MTLPGYRVAAMLRACWMVGACTATAKHAVPERSSIEIFAIWIASSPSPSTTNGAECPSSCGSLRILRRSLQFIVAIRPFRGIATGRDKSVARSYVERGEVPGEGCYYHASVLFKKSRTDVGSYSDARS